MRWKVVEIAAALAALGATIPAAALPESQPATLSDRIKAAYAEQQSDCGKGLAMARSLVELPEFASWDEPTRAGIYGIAAYCGWKTNDKDAAYRFAFDGSRLKGASPQLWEMRLEYELDGKRDAAAVDTLAALTSEYVDVLNKVPMPWLYQLNRRTKPTPAVQRRLLAILSAPEYEPADPLSSGDAFRRDYAAMLADAGDKAAAAAVMARITDPYVLIRSSLDPRLRTMIPADFDPRAAMERRLAQMREIAGSHAGSMAAVLEIAQCLRELGRFEEALATLQAASPDGPQATAFTDIADERIWWWDGMSRTLQKLGRYDDAVAAFRKGVSYGESGTANVSQTINLGEAQLRFGHVAEAMATVAPLANDRDLTSPFGQMQVRLVQGCGRLALNQQAAAKDDLAYVTAHESVSRSTALKLLLCAGDMAGSSALAIRWLDDPERRAEALLAFSDFDDPPATWPRTALDASFLTLRKRADVQAAIARAGGIRRIRLQGAEL